MELFSELYGLYYRVVEELLRQAPLSRAQIQCKVAQSGFAESVLQLLPRLLGDGAWPLLHEKDGLFFSRLGHAPRVPVSRLELRWLKAVLSDPRARLFLADAEIARLDGLLAEEKPLYDRTWFHYFDQDRDGDDYQSEAYISHFRRVLAALRERRVLDISYRTGARSGGVRIRTGSFLPLRLEYSEKNDKFRAHCAAIQQGRIAQYLTISLGRIQAISNSAERYCGKGEVENWAARLRCAQPVVVEVFPERNAIERFLLEFSFYEKQSEFDAQTGVCRVSIWYPMPDETELLVRILGFGPAVRVLAPKRFVRQVRLRVQAQAKILCRPEKMPEKPESSPH